MQLTATLVADGSSDTLLLPILEWLLGQHLPIDTTLRIQPPEWGRLPLSTATLAEKLAAARAFYPSPVYFIHRDAEKDGSWESRRQEIAHAVQQVFKAETPTYVHVIPVQMTETWLLHNEAAIRQVAENAKGRELISLPTPSRLEAVKEAKATLLDILRTASGLSGRHLRKFEKRERARLHDLAARQQQDGFAVLRALPAFRQLETEIIALAASLTN